MKKYMIDAFNYTEAVKKYSQNSNIPIIDFVDFESLIFQITKQKENRFRLKYSFSELELRSLSFSKDEFRNTKKYIDEFGETFTIDELQTRKYHYKQGQENEDDKGNIIVIKEDNLPVYRELRFDVKEETGKDRKGNTHTITEKTITDDDMDIILFITTEEIYRELEKLGLKIEGYSGILEPQKQTELAQGYFKEFNFIVFISDEEDFIKKSKEYIESKVKSKGHTIEKLKENLLGEIKKLDEEYGTNGKEIYRKNKETRDTYLLLLLQIEEIISLKEFGMRKDEFYIDLPKNINNNGIYLDENTGNVYYNGKKIGIIRLGTQKYKFFKFLYEHSGKFKTHLEIRNEIIGTQRNQDTDAKFCSDIKRRIKIEIRKYIKSSKGGYSLIP